MRILVIDDESATLAMFKLFLTAYGYEVYTAENGENGIMLFDEQKPDIVFTDIKMPGMDGLEVLRQIRQSDNEAQVIIITGHGDLEKAVEALDLDASDFINKPVDRAALDAALARALKRKNLPALIPFELDTCSNSNSFDVRLVGRLTEEAADRFHQLDIPDQITSMNMILDDSFSINRGGIDLLVTILKQWTVPEINISNITYNYARVFQMIGVDKYAALVTTDPLEQELG